MLIGLCVGVPAGLVLGQMFVDIYREFFHFPSLHFVVDPALMGLCVGVSLLSAGAGALLSVRGAMGLAPAEAMRPESPVSYRAGTWLQQGWSTGLPASVRMIGRNLLRRPWRAVGSVLGIACAMGLLLLGRFAMDAPQHMLSVQFNQVQRDDVMVTYNEARGPRALLEMAAMDGVIQVEPFRALPVWLQHGHRRKRIDVMGLMPGNGLHQLLDARLQPVGLPPQGLVLSAKLADILGVAPGDRVSLEALEGRRPVLDMPVVSVVDEMLGLGAYMDAAALARLLGEDHTSSGAYLRIEADKALQVYERLKRMPAVAGVAVAQATQQSVRETMARAFFFFSGILLVFACVIIAGMVYNSARIALSERGNELASLAVLGFTQREVAFLLLGEQVVLLALAVPVGLGVGYGLCALLVPLFDRDLFRVPLVLTPWSYAYAVLAAWGASVLSGLLVARRIRRLDLIAVLKTRE